VRLTAGEDVRSVSSEVRGLLRGDLIGMRIRCGAATFVFEKSTRSEARERGGRLEGGIASASGG